MALIVQAAVRLAPAESPATAMRIGSLLRAAPELMPSTPALLSTMDVHTYGADSCSTATVPRALAENELNVSHRPNAQILNPCARTSSAPCCTDPCILEPAGERELGRLSLVDRQHGHGELDGPAGQIVGVVLRTHGDEAAAGKSSDITFCASCSHVLLQSDLHSI